MSDEDTHKYTFLSIIYQEPLSAFEGEIVVSNSAVLIVHSFWLFCKQ